MLNRRELLVRTAQAIITGLASPALLQLAPEAPVLEPFLYNGMPWVADRCLPQTMILFPSQEMMNLYNSMIADDARYGP